MKKTAISCCLIIIISISSLQAQEELRFDGIRIYSGPPGCKKITWLYKDKSSGVLVEKKLSRSQGVACYSLPGYQNRIRLPLELAR